MERICSVGFPVYDLGHVGVMYGDNDCGKSHPLYGVVYYIVYEDSPLIPDSY